MSKRFRRPEPFGRAGLVVGIVALVFALMGGAWAASGGLTAKQKKEVKAIAKSFQGTGPAGAQGAQGTPGSNGTNGTNGKDGAAGVGGPPGPLLETLESGQTVTGAWSYADFAAGEAVITISYPFRLASPLPTSDIVFLAEGEVETADCPGTVEEPQAAPGKLCLYQEELGLENTMQSIGAGTWPASMTTGASLSIAGPAGIGTWALTAP
jgi:hypothetical protein